MEEQTEKWFWQMNWCKEHSVPASNHIWWDKSEKAYEAFQSRKRMLRDDFRNDTHDRSGNEIPFWQ